MTHSPIILIWAFLIALAVMMYVLLDGFDLGIGILFPWIRSKEHRDIMMNSIAPVWDGNETWLVLGGAGLYPTFPLAYGTLLSILYLPIMVMLGALVFRGVAFEFRFKSHRSQFLWDIAFSGGSALAAFCQGLILGTFVHGYTSVPNTAHYIVWFTPFSIVTGIAVMVGYALLGATWLIIKTEGELQKTMYHNAKIFFGGIVFFIALVSLWTPFIAPDIFARWFALPNFLYLLPLPLLTLAAVIYGFYALYHHYEKTPFLMAIALFCFCFIGLCISSWPYIIPRTVTIWQAAADVKSLKFLLVGAVILLPTLLAYSAYSYYVFKGKVRVNEGYHD